MDVGSVATGALQGAASAPSATPSPGAEADAPTPDAVARFDAAMGDQQPGGGQHTPAEEGAVRAEAALPTTTGAEAVPPGAEAPPVDAATSPGDAILRGLERMSQSFEGAMDQAGRAVSSVQPGEMMNTADLMRMQFSLMQVSLQQDVVSKVTGKATQNLDTFLKNQ